MGFFSDIGGKIDGLFESDEVKFRKECTRKGTEFEIYVANLLLMNNTPQRKYFEIEDWTRDISKNMGGFEVNSNKNPDLLIRYLPTNQQFAIECKYRSYFSRSEKFNCECIKWSYPEQIKRYQEFQRTRKIPVFVVIGIGGGNEIQRREIPNAMFCLPLSEAKYPELLPSLLQRYEREPNKRLFWNPKEKTLL